MYIQTKGNIITLYDEYRNEHFFASERRLSAVSHKRMHQSIIALLLFEIHDYKKILREGENEILRCRGS